MIGALFVWAALSKLANASDFLATLYAYELPFPRGFLKILAVILPWVELLAGLMLLISWWRETALGLIAVLLVGFLAATAQAWARGLKISCGCFDLSLIGLDSESGLAQSLESPGVAFLRNLVLAAAIVYLFRPLWPLGRPGRTLS